MASDKSAAQEQDVGGCAGSAVESAARKRVSSTCGVCREWLAPQTICNYQHAASRFSGQLSSTVFSLVLDAYLINSPGGGDGRLGGGVGGGENEWRGRREGERGRDGGAVVGQTVWPGWEDV